MTPFKINLYTFLKLPSAWLTGVRVREINSKLWVFEDEKRLYEKNSDFGDKFIKVSRGIHFLNDDRSKVKLEINKHTGSLIREIKQYTNY